ncbi:MaoC/PaaZ C-terminal domain-containing protein [Haloprofundus sp. MHR1]|uniref:MaoC/PaaZ C-terminal domain-containing protein n=1 Tax=Haloprofundus sp. MHR1 TaxID=2572921 RepID=UPI0010BF4010|nr:MaoC/PaaZ C-terminal domain-containing protein [Haloprofundus sp. MHR1]QCJ46708.1 dehydratase [Haloprofundus sp. MHR1]
MTPPTPGESYTVERTFTPEEVDRFADLSGDTQPQHTEPDDEGRRMVHGLLTATLPTQIGGRQEVLAHTMEFTFSRPVYTGERITCTWTYESVEERPDRYDLVANVSCSRGDERVLSGTVTGLVWKGENP